MSNSLAIATVTATLSRLLQEAAGEAVPGATVSTMRPESVAEGIPQPRINIYLYQVMPNTHLRNADLPTRQANGDLKQRPQVALNLYYLLSFYGDEGQLEPQRLLGQTVSLLHAQPVLSPARIRETIRTAIQPDPGHYLVSSDLADQVELVRFTPQPLNLEELSKLWSILSFHTPHALSMTYQAAVVLIEGPGTPQRALPVRQAMPYSLPFRQPVIERVQAQAGANQPILSENSIIIVGQRLRGEVTLVRLGQAEIIPSSQDMSHNQIELSLPTGLRAGVQSVQVSHQTLPGGAAEPQQLIESNVAAFILQPTIIAANAPSPTSLEVSLQPAVGRRQRVMLWLNEFNPPADRLPHAYSFKAPPNNGITDEAGAETTAIVFAISGVEPDDYLLRVQVDGAESPLIIDADPNSPTFNQYRSPQVTIP